MSALRPLLVLGILITASGFASDILGDYLGPIDYKGYLVFDYPEGENQINNIVFTVDSTLAGNLIIVSVPSPWSHSYGGGVLTLSSSSLGPGESVRVTVSLNKYFEDGEYLVTSVGTTTTGEVSQASGPLLVGEMYLLNFIAMASAYRFPLTGTVVGLGFLEWYLRRRLVEKPLMPNKPLTQSDLDKIGNILPDDLPEGGKVVVTPGMGVTSDGDLIHLDDNVSMPKSFTEQSGLEVETSDIEYRNGMESETSTLKMTGIPKYGNIHMKRPAPPLDGVSYRDMLEDTIKRIPVHAPGWTDQTVEDPGIALVELFTWMYNDLGYRLNASSEHFDFLRNYKFTGGKIRRLAIDSVTRASEKGEPVKVDHVKAALEKLEMKE
jgi:hypothetical protein